jgi:hypothetical protein
MKKYRLAIISLGLCACLLPAAQAQTGSAAVQSSSAAQAQNGYPADSGAMKPKPPYEKPATEPFGIAGSGTLGAGPAYSGFFPSSGVGTSTSVFGWTADERDGEGPVSVVTFKAPDQKTLDETAEDLNIMSLIFSQDLERALGEEGEEKEGYKLGIPMLLQTGGRWVDASYIEGFGAVFNLKVRFPLASIGAPEKDAQSSPGNSEWEQARRALAGATEADPRHWNRLEKANDYSPKLVETLKKRVIELLKNASNLRHLQPEEWIAVTFAGPPNRVAPSLLGTATEDPTRFEQGSSAPTLATATADKSESQRQPGAGPRNSDRATVMTIRIKKKHADAFAADKMSQEEFFHAAEITTYLGPVVLDGAANDYVRLQGGWRRPR